MKPPRPTTRRSGAFTDLELEMLAVAAKVSSGLTWCIRGHSTNDQFAACFNLQRWGYFAPTTEGREFLPEVAEGLIKLGWRITLEGREALRRLAEATEKAA